jgi:hypothetical protein
LSRVSNQELEEVAMRHSFITPTLSLAFLSLFSIELAAQNPQDASVADAARQAREQKKSASKPAKVITNDALAGAPQQYSTTSPGPAAPSPDPITQPMTNSQTGPAETEAGSTDANPTGSKSGTAAEAADTQSKPELTALKQQIADQQKEVDLLVRLYTLDQDAFLSNPDHAKDPQGKAKLEEQQQEIQAKVAEVARLKGKLDAIAPGESAKVATPKP